MIQLDFSWMGMSFLDFHYFGMSLLGGSSQFASGFYVTKIYQNYNWTKHTYPTGLGFSVGEKTHYNWQNWTVIHQVAPPNDVKIGVWTEPFLEEISDGALPDFPLPGRVV